MKISNIVGWMDSVAALTAEGYTFSAQGLPQQAEAVRPLGKRLLIAWGLESLADQVGFTRIAGYDAEGRRFFVPVFASVVETLPRSLLLMERMGHGRTLRSVYRDLGLYQQDYAHGLRVRRSESRKGSPWFPDQPAEPFLIRMAKRPLTPAAFNYDRAVGVEMETFGEVDHDAVQAALPMWARAGSDGSINPSVKGAQGHEVRALFVRRELEVRLWKLCEKLRSLNLRVNASCGLHVHLDQRGEERAAVLKRAKVMDAWLHAMRELVPASRRANDFCKFGVSEGHRYHAVNFTAFQKYQTLEIRLHSGTTDYTKVLAWIRLCELLAAMRTKPKAAGCIATLEQLPLASHDLAYWRARHRELNPTMYAANITSEQEG